MYYTPPVLIKTTELGRHHEEATTRDVCRARYLNPHTLRTDHWRCRFPMAGTEAEPEAISRLLLRIAGAGLDAVKTDNLYEFDGVRGYSYAQGE